MPLRKFRPTTPTLRHAQLPDFVELPPGRRSRVARSAGVYCQLMAKDGDYAQLRLPSGEVRRFHLDCRAVVGQVGNLDHENVSSGKAGRTRWLGRNPSVRGVAMN